MSKEMYYGTVKVELVADIGDEYVVELIYGEYEDGDEYGSYFEPAYTKIIVPKNMITEHPLVDDSIINIHKQMIIDTESEIRKMKSDANSKIREQHRTYTDQIKELKERGSKYRGINEYLKFIDGEYEYFVFEACDYSNKVGIRRFDEAMCSGDKHELAAISYRAGNHHNKKYFNDGSLFLNQYSDDSGSCKYKIRGFVTLDEAKSFFKSQIDSGDIKPSGCVVTACDKWDIQCDKVDEYKTELEKTHKADIIKKRTKLKAELETLKNLINEYL